MQAGFAATAPILPGPLLPPPSGGPQSGRAEPPATEVMKRKAIHEAFPCQAEAYFACNSCSAPY